MLLVSFWDNKIYSGKNKGLARFGGAFLGILDTPAYCFASIISKISEVS